MHHKTFKCVYKTCRVTFAIRVPESTVTSWGGGTGEAVKPVTSVQDCVSTSVSMTPLDIFEGQFLAMFVATKTGT